jgi:hypothetical protein
VATVDSLAKAVDPRSLGDLSPAALHNLMSVPPEHSSALAAEMAQLGRSPRTIDRVLRGLQPQDALAGNELRAAQGLQRVVRQALQPTPQEIQAVAKGMGAAVQDGLPPEAVTITVGGRVVTFKPASYETFVEQSTRGGTNLPNRRTATTSSRRTVVSSGDRGQRPDGPRGPRPAAAARRPPTPSTTTASASSTRRTSCPPRPRRWTGLAEAFSSARWGD